MRAPLYKCRRCRQVKSHHTEIGDKFFCAATGFQAEFKEYIVSPGRISNSFSEAEVKALDHIVAQLLRGAFGPQPAVVASNLQSLAKKTQSMARRLKARSEK